MKLRNQVLGLGLAGVLSALLVGVTGLFNTSLLATAFEGSINMELALQKSQEADMMHDVIRGDVLLALLSAQSKDTGGFAEAQKDLLEHTTTFNNALAEMSKMPISEEAKAKVTQVGPALKAYVESAAEVQKLANTDAVAAQAAMSGFQKSFKTLEGLM